MDRLVIDPDEKIVPLTLMLKATLPAIAAELTAENFDDLIGGIAQNMLLRAVERCGADELLIWARSGNGLLVAWSSLEPVGEVVRAVTSDRDEGLIARVFASSRSENGSPPELSAGAWTNLEERRGRTVAGITASPVILFEISVAVLALVTYRNDGEGSSGQVVETANAAEAAGLLALLIEDRLLRASIGLAIT